MFSRSTTNPSATVIPQSSTVRRRDSIISDPDTSKKRAVSSGMSRHALAAAQHAFISGQHKPTQDPQLKQQTPVSNPRRSGLSEIDPNQIRPAYTRPPNLRFSRHGAPPESVSSLDYGAESLYSEITPPKSALSRFYPDYYKTYDDDNGTIIHRQSPLPQGSGSYPARMFREPSTSTLNTALRSMVAESFEDRTPTGTPEPISSTPSSFRRLGRSKSMMGRTSMRPATDTQRLENRKSMSFLRGGTDFMPQSMKQQCIENKPRERMSFYTPSSARPMPEPSLLQDPTIGYRGRNDKGDWGALRWAMKRKARRITQVFGSVKGIFGKKKSYRGPEMIANIPEQHIISSRPHFGEYVPSISEDYGIEPEPPIIPQQIPMEQREKPKIRSSYVVTRKPALHIVPSREKIPSDVSSISEAHTTPERNISLSQRYDTGSTWSSNWNSTVTTHRPDFSNSNSLDEVFDRDTSTPAPGKGFQPLYLPPRPQRRDRINVDVRRLYSALVKKMDDSPPQLKPVPVRESFNGEVTTSVLDSNIHPELARVFESRRSAFSLNAGQQRPPTLRRTSRVTFTTSPDISPSPVAEVPKTWSNSNAHADMEPGSLDECPASVGSGSTESAAKREAQHNEAIHAMTTSHALFRSASRRKREVSFAEPSTSHQTATCGVDDKPHQDTCSPETHSDDGIEESPLTQWDLQMLKHQAEYQNMSPEIQAWQKHRDFSFPGDSNKENIAPYHLESFSPSRDTELHRPQSAAAYRYHNTSTPVRRTATAMGHTPIRTGLVARDVNLPSPTCPPVFRKMSLERSDSRISLSGRQSRASMKNFDVGEAVRRQFGPIAGDDESDLDDVGDHYYGNVGAFL